MKKLLFAAVALALGTSLADDVYIVVDQFGYRPGDDKFAVLRDPQKGFDSLLSYTPGSTLDVVDASTGSVVYSGSPALHNGGATDTASGDKIWWFDFSSVTAPGTYYVRDASDNTKKSFSFSVKEDVYNDVLKAAVRMLFYQRVGAAKDARYAGTDWSDVAGFSQDAHARSFMDSTDASLEMDVSGGWFDAGDYNKYTDCTGDYVEMLLMAYFDRPRAFTDDYNIPESGNGIPDVVDEAFWGLDYLLRLQKDDGSVLSVVGEGSGAPPSTVTSRTYYGEPSATAAYAAAKAFAIGAKAAKIFKGETYYQKLYDAAVKAFTWAEAHPDSMFYNNDKNHGTVGLAAGQQEVTDTTSRKENRLNAALRLYVLTGDASYKKLFEDHYTEFPLLRWWGDSYRYHQHSMFILYLSLPDADATIKSAIEDKFVYLMNKEGDFMSAFPTDGYRSFSRDYNWGSNGHKSAYGTLFDRLANLGISGIDKDTYHRAAEEYLHYILGVNPFGFVYLTNMGSYGASKSISSIFHSWFNEGTKWDANPAPGYLAGGPYSDYKWDACCDNQSCGSDRNNKLCYAEERPVGEPNEKMYRDINNGWPLNFWQVTEPSVGYQVKFIHLVSRFVEEKGVDPSDPTAMKKASLLRDGVSVTVEGPHVQITSQDPIREVRIFDLNDREVLYRHTYGNSVSLTVPQLPAGIYFAKVGTARASVVKRIALR